jgi:microcystin-dependent protein
MAYPENTYTGNGSTTNYSFTFPYLEETDIKVSLDGVTTTAYSLANATTVSFTAAPANGVAIRIYRETDVSSAQATFFAGSAIRAQDLNNNNLQTLYASQEATSNAALAPTAITTANAASTTATQAANDAATALTAASNAVAFVPVANVAAIPGSPSNNDYIEVLDATGIESFSPLTGVPVGFVGDSGLAARLQYTTSGSTWNWVNYIANDAETRYLKDQAGTVDATNLATDAVTTAKITDANVTTAKIADANVTTAKIADANVTTAKLADNSVTAAKIAAGAAVPSGAVFYFAANSAPTGYLEANGAAISRTTYAALFAVVGTTFGSGDGSTTFNLPDLRGEFLRGWDNGKGTDSGRTFGSFQDHQLQQHSHTELYNTPSSGQDQAGSGSGDNDNTSSRQTSTSGTTGNFGFETRPRNIALLPCIKT